MQWLGQCAGVVASTLLTHERLPAIDRHTISQKMERKCEIGQKIKEQAADEQQRNREICT